MLLEKVYIKLLYLIYVLIPIVEVFAAGFSQIGKIGTGLWLISYLFTVFFFIKSLVFIFQSINKGKFLLTVGTVLLLSFIVFINITNPRNLSNESTQEINCALDQFVNSPDSGYNQTCLFGYPARQFYLPLLPSFFFGRNFFNLNFGMSLYYYIGIIIFLSGVIKFLDNKTRGDLIGAIILSLIFHIYYFNHFMFRYEQSIFPFSLGLILCGLYLHYLKNKSKEIILLMGLSVNYLIFSYTPGLSLATLALIIFLFSLLKEKNTSSKFFLMTIIASTVIGILYSFKYRSDVNLIVQERSNPQLFADLFRAFSHILFITEPKPVVSPQFHLIFLFVLFTALSFKFGWKLFFVAVWIILTIAGSVIFKGYAYFDIDFRLHRATVIFPVLLTMILFIFDKYQQSLVVFLNQNIGKKLLLYLYIFLLITGILFQNKLINEKELHKHLTLINWLENILDKKSKNQIFIDSGLYPINDVGNLNDSMTYFNPNIEVRVMTEDCYEIKTANPDAVVYILYRDIEISRCLNNNLAKLIYVDRIRLYNDEIKLAKLFGRN